MSEPRAPGYLRFLSYEKYHAHFQKNNYKPMPGFMFKLTKCGLAVEVKSYSAEHIIGFAHGGDFSKKQLDEMPLATLFFVAEIYFVFDKYDDFIKLLHDNPQVANWIFRARSFCPTRRPYRPSRMDKAQSFIKPIIAANAARAALLEVQS